jgi:CO/xanthine dehydrogenase Mo-binding subunit
VQAACQDLKQQIIKAAVRANGGGPGDWHIKEGRLWRGETSFSVAEIARSREDAEEFKGVGSHRYPSSVDEVFAGGVEHWAPGAAAAEVEVDLETGEVRVLQFSAVADAGKAVHFQSAKRQIEGGAVMGFGIALFEELLYQDGQLQNADAFQYRLPAMNDLPESYFSSIVENGDGPGPFGSKAIAQVSISCVAPAIGNAICDAIGVHVRSTPLSPEKILRALGKLGSEK